MKTMETGAMGRSRIANDRGARRGLVGGFALLAVLIQAALIPTVLIQTAASAADVPRLMVVPQPLITDISPIEVRAGKETVLRLRGRSLHNGLLAIFSADIRTEPMSRASADGTQAFLRIRIAPNAQVGRRQLTLIVLGDRVAQNAYITVQAPQVNMSTFPRFSVKPKPEPAGIAPLVSILSVVTPSTARIGERVRLTLEGRNLMRGLRCALTTGLAFRSNHCRFSVPRAPSRPYASMRRRDRDGGRCVQASPEPGFRFSFGRRWSFSPPLPCEITGRR